MKLFTVWVGDYSDRTMYGIFSTKELAEQYIVDVTTTPEYSNYYNNNDYTIEEYELDHNINMKYKYVYSIMIDIDGNTKDAPRPAKYLVPGDSRGVSRNYSNYTSGIVFSGRSYESPEHALKLAVEERQKYLREKLNV